MEAEAGAQRPADEDGGFWDDLRERPWSVAIGAALLLLVWRLWG